MNLDLFNEELAINLAVIAGLTVAAIIIARTLVFKALMSFASHSQTEHDDTFIKTLIMFYFMIFITNIIFIIPYSIH